MNAGDRIVVVGGPWDVRWGCRGVIVDRNSSRIYPFHGLAAHEEVILLDNDPLRGADLHSNDNAKWSCVIGRRDLRLECQ